MMEPQKREGPLPLYQILKGAIANQPNLHRTVNYDLYSLTTDERATKFIDKGPTREVFNLLTGRIASTNKISPKVAMALNRRIRAMSLKLKIFMEEDQFHESLEIDGIEMYANMINYGAIDGYRGELATTQRQKINYEGLPGYGPEPKKKRWGIF